ncbi:MAG: PorV/PorQ family protein [Candidatus Muiribacteriota bacterium]
MQNKILIPLILLVLIYSLHAGVILDSITKYNLGVRPNSMGDTFVGMADDISSMIYNPAGLSKMDYTSFYFLHKNKFSSDIKNDYFAYSRPLLGGVAGLSLARESVDNIPETDSSRNIIGMLNVSKSMFNISYSRKLSARENLGFSLKYLENDLAGLKGTGLGFDIGYLRKVHRRYTFGLSIKDLFSGIDWDSGKNDSIPLSYRIGLGYESRLKDFRYGVDFIVEEKGNDYFSFGGEYKVSENGIIRAGLKDGNITAGFSVLHDSWLFDYAYQTHGIENTSVFSLTMNISDIITKADREIERARDGQIVRKARTVPQDRTRDYASISSASQPVQTVLEDYSSRFASEEAEKVKEKIEMRKEKLSIPDEAKMRYKLGNTYVLEGVYSQAIEEYLKALEIHPQYAQARYNLAALYEKMGVRERSIQEYQLVTEIDPMNINAYMALGKLYQDIGNIGEAIKHFNKVIIIAPNSESAKLAEKLMENL